MSGSDSDEGLGGFFGGEEPEEENNTKTQLTDEEKFPIHSISVDRRSLAKEGTTYNSFTSHYEMFDNPVHDGGEARLDRLSSYSSEKAETEGTLVLPIYYREKRHSLWGHKLWNAAKYLCKQMDSQRLDCRGKRVLELGAGLGAPSVMAFRNGASLVVSTDYPDDDLLEIIEKNMVENCGAGNRIDAADRQHTNGVSGNAGVYVDADIAEWYQREALAVKQQRYRQMHRGDDDDGIPSALTDEEVAAVAVRSQPVWAVEPLLWGNRDHINKVLEYSTKYNNSSTRHWNPNKGFDIVILSDILFNHVCNEDLADTLAMTLARPSSSVAGAAVGNAPAAYCVFSHHRAHKQMEDFEFFDKVVARGLRYCQIDEQDYPLMFPEDRGPESVRQPVKCYKIYYEAGEDEKPGKQQPEVLLEVNGGAKDTYDVVIQGSGLVQCYLAAALAMQNGTTGVTEDLRILLCDGAEHYGATAFTSFSSLDDFADYIIAQQRRKKQGGCCGIVVDNREAYYTEGSGDDNTNTAKGNSLAMRRSRWTLDVLPSLFLCRGESILHIIETKLSSGFEFHFLSHFSFLRATHSKDGGVAAGGRAVGLWRVPLSRSQIYANSDISLLDKRRLLKFIKDVEATLAEEVHAKDANPSDDPNYTDKTKIDGAAASGSKVENEVGDAAAIAFLAKMKDASGGKSYGSLRELLSDRYSLSDTAIDYITLMGALDCSLSQRTTSSDGGSDGDNTHILTAIHQIRLLLRSVGFYGGNSPFLLSSFGTSEPLVQALARQAAVWGATVVLNKSVVSLGVDGGSERLYTHLSNGQAVRARCVVLPQEAADAVPMKNTGSWTETWALACERQQQKLAEASSENGTKGTTVGEKELADACYSNDGNSGISNNGSGEADYARVTLVAKVPLFSRELLSTNQTAPNVNARGEQEEAEGSDDVSAPTAFFLVRLPLEYCRNNGGGSEGKSDVVVYVHQLGAEVDVVPPPEEGGCRSSGAVVHFTAALAGVEPRKLYAFVEDYFLSDHSSGARDGMIFSAYFTVTAADCARDSLKKSSNDPISEVYKSDNFALSERLKLLHSKSREQQRLHRGGHAHRDQGTHGDDDEEREFDYENLRQRYAEFLPATRHTVASYLAEKSALHSASAGTKANASTAKGGDDANAEEAFDFTPMIITVPSVLPQQLVDPSKYLAAAKECFHKAVSRLPHSKVPDCHQLKFAASAVAKRE